MKLIKILVPTDFSDATGKAVAYAADLARGSDAELLLCHVLEPSPYPMAPIVGGVDGMPNERELYDAIVKELEQAQREFVPDGVRSRTVMLGGTPHTEIIKFAKEEGVDLIVMPTHGRSGIAHLLLGSVVEKIIRRAHCPVLVFREQQ